MNEWIKEIRLKEEEESYIFFNKKERKYGIVKDIADNTEYDFDKLLKNRM